jgi:hypothetical protein
MEVPAFHSIDDVGRECQRGVEDRARRHRSLSGVTAMTAPLVMEELVRDLHTQLVAGQRVHADDPMTADGAAADDGESRRRARSATFRDRRDD